MTITRITNSMISQQVLNDIESSEDTLTTTEEQLSSGKSINEPSDDPYGASLAVQLNGQLSSLTNYTSNVSDGQAWTSAGMSAISSITGQVQRAQELVTEAGNGDESPSDLNAIGAELTQLVEGIKSDANAQYDNQYIFSGSSTSTEPYPDNGDASDTSDGYAGGTGNVTRAIGAGQSVTVNANLSSVLGSGNGDGGLLDQLSSIATALSSPNPSSADRSALNTTDLTNLSNSLSGLNQLAASLGAASDRLTLASSRISNLQTGATDELSNDQDVNYAATYTNYSNQEAAFEAALKAGASIVQESLMNFLSTSA